MRVEMTDGKRVFFPSQCHVCLLSNPSFFERVTEESKEVQLWLREEKEEKVQLLLSQGSFITINCVMTPADIQIDLPSSGDYLACAEVSYTKDSFVSLMKGFLPQCFFKPKSTYFILLFDCRNGLIYEVNVETCISLVVLQPENEQGMNLKSPVPALIFQKNAAVPPKSMKELRPNCEINDNLCGKSWQNPV